jgi:type I restriction enzyme S subunit
LKEYNNYLYFKEVLENYLLEMKQISKGTNTRYLTLKLLNTFNLPVPPISLQNEFEHKVETIEKQKELLNQSLELLEENYKSIMDKAFKGQLFN